MQTLQTLSRNALTNWLNLAVNVIVLFYLSPIVVRELGTAQYGIWVLINTITGYVGLVEAGVTVSTGRFLNFHLGQRNPKKASATISTAIAFYVLIGLFLLVLLLVAPLCLPTISSFEPNLNSTQIYKIAQIQVVAIVFSFLTAIFAQLLNSNNRIDLRNYVSIASVLLRAWLTIITLRNAGDLIDLAEVQLTTSIASLIAMVIISRQFGSKIPITLRAINRPAINELFGLGKWAMLNNISSKVDHQSDIVLVGAMFNSSSVAHYSVVQTLVDYALTLIENVISVASPDVTKRAGEGNIPEIVRFVDHGSRFSALFGVPVFVGIAVFGSNFIELWMGPEFSSAYYVLIILTVGKGVCLFSQGLGIAIWAVGQIRSLTILNLAVSIGSIATSIYFVQGTGLGIEGVALGTCLAMFSQQLLILPIIGRRSLGIDLKWFYRVVIGRFILIAAILYPIALLLKNTSQIDNWGDFILVILAFSMLGLPFAIWLLWQPGEIKAFVKKYTRQQERP